MMTDMTTDLNTLPDTPHKYKVGEIYTCVICGKFFNSKSPRQKCCSTTCSAENGRRYARIQNERRRELRHETESWKKEKLPKNDSDKKPIKHKRLTISQIQEQARAERLTYGQFVAKYHI